MNTAYKLRLYPNKIQQSLIIRIIGCVRFVYNYFLALRIDQYRFLGTSMSYQDCANDLVMLKRLFPFLKAADSIALQQGLRHLDTAFRNFFERRDVGFPKFRKKRSCGSYSTIAVNGNIRFLDKRHIQLPKLGSVRVRMTRPIPDGYVIKSATVSVTSAGEFYVSILFEHENQVTNVIPKSFLGLDYSSAELYVDSDGDSPSYPQYYRAAEERLAREQRKLSHMKLRSRNWYKQKRRIAKLHTHVANQRRDFLHKLSHHLAETYDCICIEDLDMRTMSRGLRLGKSTMDNGWGEFVRMLQYKLERRGKRLVIIDKWFPSTKTCHMCGHIQSIGLNDRTYICPICGGISDRDHNAAINIRNEGMRLALAG